jgi:4-amino-4-deoxy-L-arabinose transferase-like glycosyltransferase
MHENNAKAQRHALLAMLAISAIALLTREHFVLANIPEAPIRGDIVQYARYAHNLVEHGVFSSSPANAGSIVPDAYRGPGYPFLLAVTMILAGEHWYALALQANVLMGTLTCTLLFRIARPWLGVGPAAIAGLLMALWPHHIAASAALLSEVAFGFFQIVALAAAAAAMRKGGLALGPAVLSGAAFGFSCLINPVMLLFIPACAAMIAACNGWRSAATLLLGASLMVVPWFARNSLLNASDASAGPGRATLNFVQGSWPNYHAAHRSLLAQDANSDVAERVIAAINEEASLIDRSPREGFTKIVNRYLESPAWYARWYLFEKPWLLWTWDIQLGAGDSTFERHPSLRYVNTLYRSANLPLFLLAMCFSAATLWQTHRRIPLGANGAAALMAGLFVYFTLVHTVFQAEPRYANAYRWLQVGLAVAALVAVRNAIAQAAGRSRDQTVRVDSEQAVPPSEA